MKSATNSLLIDLGNSRLKWRLAANSAVEYCAGQDIGEFALALRKLAVGGGVTALVCSVGSAERERALLDCLATQNIPYIKVAVEAATDGLICGYEQPHQLGVDRWVAMLGVWRQQRRGFILVDAGTALTLDVVDDAGRHQGGYILAGLGLQMDALARASDRLGAVILAGQQSGHGPHPIGGHALYPSNSWDALSRGAIAAVEALVARALAHTGFTCDRLFLGGGDAGRIASLFPEGHVRDNLVLDGLESYTKAPMVRL